MSKRSALICVAIGCSNYSTPENKAAGLSFHRFPKEPQLREKWRFRVQRENWTPTDHSRICSAHFEDACFYNSGIRARLLPGTEPTLFGTPARFQPKKSAVRQVLERSSLDTSHCDATTEMPGTSSVLRSLPISKTTPVTGTEPTLFSTPARFQPKKSLVRQVLEQSSRVTLHCDATTEMPGTSSVHRSLPISKTTPGDHSYSLLSPRILKRKLDAALSALVAAEKKLKLERQCNRRLRRKLSSVQNLLGELQKKQLITEQAEQNLLSSFDDSAFARIASRMRSAATGKVKAQYPLELRNFALSLYFCSSKAYDFIRSQFGNCLPHPKTLINW